MYINLLKKKLSQLIINCNSPYSSSTILFSEDYKKRGYLRGLFVNVHLINGDSFSVFD